MATFPALSPAARSYSMGRFAMTTQAGLGGNQIKFLHSIKKTGVAMTLAYENLTQAEMASIRDHYRGQQGSFVSFLLPSAAWAGQSSVTNIVPSGTRWKYVAPPEETQKSGGLVDVTVSLLVESNFTPATSGGVFWPSGGGGGGGSEIVVSSITYSQSSVYTGNTAATNATMTNGSINETTATGTLASSSAHITMDFGAVFPVANVYLGADYNNTLANGWGPTYTSGRRLVYSTDGSTWTTFEASIATFTSSAIRVYSVSFSARYIRIEPVSSDFVAVTEFYATST
ncbi:MAG: discoidin domain-containing protein [Synechococcus sp. ELA057]